MAKLCIYKKEFTINNILDSKILEIDKSMDSKKKDLEFQKNKSYSQVDSLENTQSDSTFFDIIKIQEE